MTRGPTLRIVSINDVYTLENLPRLANLIRHYAANEPADAFLAVLAGDFLAPSMLSSLDAGLGMVECLNAAGITHVILGNHEDDVTPEDLRRRIKELRGTWLSTNVHDFDAALPPHQVITVTQDGGRSIRVGLLGVVMTDGAVYRHAPFGGATLEPPNAAALREAELLLTTESCTTVIPITHQPMADDRALARAPGSSRFPVIVGGHEHDVHIENVEGTWIVKAGSDASAAVVTDLTWALDAPPPGTPDVPTTTVHLESVSGYEEDKALRALVDRHMTRVVELQTAALLPLEAGQVLSSVGSRARQTSFGTFVCSRTRDALHAEACLLNGGGIRANRDYSHRVTYGDIEAELPFDNEMVVVRLPGRVLRDAVRSSRASAPAEAGGYLQVDDGTVVGPDGDVTDVLGAPLDMEREYAVALVRAFLTGMDHIQPLVEFARAHPEKVPPIGSGRELKQVLVGVLSVALWRRLGTFESIDANHDGKLSEAEVRDAVARALGEAASPITVALAMGAVDRLHTHEISREDVLAAVEDEKGYAAPMTESHKPAGLASGGPGLPAIDVREYGGKKDGERQAMDRRLFMQLLVFDAVGERPADAIGEDLTRLLHDRGIAGVVYADTQSPRGLGLLTWSDDPAHFVKHVRPLFSGRHFEGVAMRPGWAMIGRTYGQGHEPDLEHVLLHRPIEQVTRDVWPWHVWYPLRRSGAFAKLPTEDIIPMMREHAQIGMAYGQSELAHDVRLACHGLDAEDNEFVIGLVGKDLHPLSHLVQAMRKTRQTSEFIVKMGPFFVGYVLHRSTGA